MHLFTEWCTWHQQFANPHVWLKNLCGCGNRDVYKRQPNYIVPSVGSDSSLLSDLSGYIIFPDAAGLSKASSDSVRSTVKITDLLDTSDSSFIKVDPSSGSASKEDGDVDGPFSVGYSITETVDKKETNLLVFASSGAFSESFTPVSYTHLLRLVMITYRS